MKFELDIDRRNISNEMLLQDVTTVAKQLGTRSPTADQYREYGRFNPSTVVRRFGGWRPALLKAGPKPVHHNSGIDVEDALNDLRAVAKHFGRRTVSNKEYSTQGQYSDAPLLRAFGSWNAALLAAGLEASKRARIPTEELFENLARMWRTLGRKPHYGEVAKPFSAFGAGTYESRFGSWRKALEAFVEWVNEDQPAQAPSSLTSTAASPPPTTSRAIRRTPRAVNNRLRIRVLHRDKYRCCICGSSPAKGHAVDLEVDHVVPWSKGGETVLENLQTLCETCNSGKSDLELEPPGV